MIDHQVKKASIFHQTITTAATAMAVVESTGTRTHDVHEVYARIDVSSWPLARDPAALQARGITHMLSYTPDYAPSAEVAQVLRGTHAVAMQDSFEYDIGAVLPELTQLMHEWLV